MPHMKRTPTVLVAALTVTLAGCGSSTQSATGMPTTTTPAGSSYVTKQAHDAHVVVVSYQEVQAGAQMLGDGSNDVSTAASFQQLLTQAKGGFDGAENSFILADTPNGTGDANKEAAAAIREFSDAMSSARAYVDNRKPSDLADFGTHWGQGRKWWNEAVNKLWGAANQPAPTV